MGGIGELLLAVSLLFGGGYLTRWWNEEPRIAKTIDFQIPKNLTEEYRQPNCFEDIGTSCDKIIPQPRYLVSEEAMYNDVQHSKKKTLYLKKVQDLIDIYNQDKYVED